ncbi:MAG: UDP-N-acetylglucosamine 1-carboxyvinyltransferase [Oscillospiraceae bacterium]
MEYISVRGGRKLQGEVSLCGAKNSILPLLCATILVEGKTVFDNCPNLSDVRLSCKILNTLGVQAQLCGKKITCINKGSIKGGVSHEMMSGMRSSITFLGPLLAKNGRVRMYYPGGCKLGERPVDIHIEIMKALGAVCSSNGDEIEFEAADGLRGADITLRFPSVGATENAIMAACTAKGKTKIIGAAREPEIRDLIDYLCKCGAAILTEEDGTISIDGVKELRGTKHSVIPDRILAATVMSAVCVAGGRVHVRGAVCGDMVSIFKRFKKAGAEIEIQENGFWISMTKTPRKISQTICAPHPFFPTDAGPLLAAVLAYSDKKSEIYDSVFENRFFFAKELEKFGFVAKSNGRTLCTARGETLDCARVMATDLRAGAALVCAALAITGQTKVFGAEHIDRGYEALEELLRSLGADTWRQEEYDERLSK